MLNTHNTSSKKSSMIGWLSSTVGQILVSLFVPIVTFLVLWQGYLFLSRTEAPQIFQMSEIIIMLILDIRMSRQVSKYLKIMIMLKVVLLRLVMILLILLHLKVQMLEESLITLV